MASDTRKTLFLAILFLVVLSGCAVNAIEPVVLTIQAQPTPTLFIPPVPLAEYAEYCSALEGSARFTDDALSKCGCPSCDKVPSFGGLPEECMALCR